MNPLTLVKRIQNINSKEAALGISDEASWHAKYKDSAYVFVGGISFDLTEGDLLAVFAQYGEVVDVNLVRDKGTGKSKGFAFLAYEDQRSTNLAVDNLNGAQINGRIIRVDHVTKYKKKEEEDEETERQKREARGVCRAFQRGECTRGAGCKFSHDEQRAANTGWGQQDTSSKWGHEKYEGPRKSDKISGNERPSENYHKVSDSRQEKRSRRQDEYGIEKNSREDYRREGKKLEMHRDNEYDSRDDHTEREEKRLRRNRADEFEPKSREDEKRLRRIKEDEFEPKSREDEKRLRRIKGDEFEPMTREDEKKFRRNKEDDFEPKSREDEKRKGSHKSEADREEQSRRGRNKSSAHDRDFSSHHRRERDDHRHKSDR